MLKAERLGNIDLRDEQWCKLFYNNSATLILSKASSFGISCEVYNIFKVGNSVNGQIVSFNDQNIL